MGSASRVRLEIDGPTATLVNDRPQKHNAFDDAMDDELFAALDDLARRPEVRVVIWRGEGPSFSSGRDVDAINAKPTELTHHELMQRVHDGARRIMALPVPIIAALHGWVMGVSFQRALLCDIRIASDDARFRLPEIGHGFIPDSGGVARLFQMRGHGAVSDLVLTGRPMDAREALRHGVVSRVVAPDELDATARGMADTIAAAPALTAGLARSVVGHLGTGQVQTEMDEEMLAQTVISTSHDYTEMRRARREHRAPQYRGG